MNISVQILPLPLAFTCALHIHCYNLTFIHQEQIKLIKINSKNILKHIFDQIIAVTSFKSMKDLTDPKLVVKMCEIPNYLKEQLVLHYHLSPDFQNYLRTQTGSTTTINIIICTVDYLLRLQV